MVGIINFLREDSPVAVVGKLFYLGGESLAEGRRLLVEKHYLNCSDPDINPARCNECDLSWTYSDGSFPNHNGDPVYTISEVETAFLQYYNDLSPSGWDQAQYRPFRWITITDPNGLNKYKTIKVLVDKDDDCWYLLAELKEPISISSTYISLLKNHFEDA